MSRDRKVSSTGIVRSEKEVEWWKRRRTGTTEGNISVDTNVYRVDPLGLLRGVGTRSSIIIDVPEKRFI